MSWTYKQSTGELDHNGAAIGAGYSGHGAGLNNPAMQNVHDVGPIPRELGRSVRRATLPTILGRWRCR
jgi:hypothetical protein